MDKEWKNRLHDVAVELEDWDSFPHGEFFLQNTEEFHVGHICVIGESGAQDVPSLIAGLNSTPCPLHYLTDSGGTQQ